MPASERGAPAPATVSDVRLPMQDRHGVAEAPARLVRLIRPPTAAAGVVGVRPGIQAAPPRTQRHGAGSRRGRDPSAAPANLLSCREWSAGLGPGGSGVESR
eukprot:scaffold11693_cov115-Isochrysis_galbana.AAC.11